MVFVVHMSNTRMQRDWITLVFCWGKISTKTEQFFYGRSYFRSSTSTDQGAMSSFPLSAKVCCVATSTPCVASP